MEQHAKPPSGRPKRYVYGTKATFYLKYRAFCLESGSSFLSFKFDLVSFLF